MFKRLLVGMCKLAKRIPEMDVGRGSGGGGVATSDGARDMLSSDCTCCCPDEKKVNLHTT